MASYQGPRPQFSPVFFSRALAVLSLLILAAPCAAQELSPRAYWPAPKGTRVLMVGYAYSSGDVVIDPSMPLVGVSSKIKKGQIGLIQTFSLAGRTANLVLELPGAWGTTVGTFEGQPARRDFSGFGDIAGTLSINLLGAPAMTAPDFQGLRQDPRPILGASLKVVAPTGDYDPELLINVGANRWAVKAELGQIIPLKPKLMLEFELGAWIMGDNDNFMGATREQDPIYSAEVHLVRRIEPGRWASLEANFFRGGRTTVDGQPHDDLQRNSNFGGTFVWTFKGRHAVKIGLNTALFTESGGDYVTALISYMFRIN